MSAVSSRLKVYHALAQLRNNAMDLGVKLCHNLRQISENRILLQKKVLFTSLNIKFNSIQVTKCTRFQLICDKKTLVLYIGIESTGHNYVCTSTIASSSF